jgi:hypothetical protein
MLLIHDVVVITVDPTRRIVTDAAIAIDGERIVAIGKSAALGQRFADAERIEGRGMIAIPGLIDTHGHADQSLLRGLGDGRHWMPFLDEIVEPYLRERDPADAVVAYELSGIEMLLPGRPVSSARTLTRATIWRRSRRSSSGWGFGRSSRAGPRRWTSPHGLRRRQTYSAATTLVAGTRAAPTEMIGIAIAARSADANHGAAGET